MRVIWGHPRNLPITLDFCREHHSSFLPHTGLRLHLQPYSGLSNPILEYSTPFSSSPHGPFSFSSPSLLWLLVSSSFSIPEIFLFLLSRLVNIYKYFCYIITSMFKCLEWFRFFLQQHVSHIFQNFRVIKLHSKITESIKVSGSLES